MKTKKFQLKGIPFLPPGKREKIRKTLKEGVRGAEGNREREKTQ